MHTHTHTHTRAHAHKHTHTHIQTHTGFTVIPLAILDDNYSYIVVDDTSKVAVAIDPADPEAIKVHMSLCV